MTNPEKDENKKTSKSKSSNEDGTYENKGSVEEDWEDYGDDNEEDS